MAVDSVIVRLLLLVLSVQGLVGQLFPCPDRCQCYADHEQNSHIHLICKWEQLNSTVLATLARPDLVRTLTIRCSFIGHQVDRPSVHLFRGLVSLERLEMDRCRVKNLPGSFFAGLNQLYSLILRNAGLEDLPKNIFDYIPKLMTLDLSKNQLRMEPYAIRNLKSLIHLDLSHNNITFLTNTLIGLVSLRVVSLNNNQIGNIDFRRFPEGLTDLSLRNNWISNVHFVPHSVRNLRRLDLAGNRLQFVAAPSTGAVNVLPPTLRHLDLSNNQINFIQEDSFSQMGKLGLLDLSNNTMTEIKETSLKGPKKDLKLLLAQNPLKCHCSVRWIVKPDDGHIVADAGAVMCASVLDPEHRVLLSVAEDRNQLMCPYRNMCEANCPCCEQKTCECRFHCPQECTCYRSFNTSIDKTSKNVMDCDKLRLDKVPALPSPLTELRIDGPHWKRLDMEKLEALPNLRSIKFINTELTNDELKPLSSLQNLTHLEISSSQLTEIPSWITELKHLRQLFLNQNPLRLTSATLARLEHIKKVKLGGSPNYDCNCNMPTALQRWLTKEQNRVKLQDIYDVFCDLDGFGTVRVEEALLDGNSTICQNLTETRQWMDVVDNIITKHMGDTTTPSTLSSTTTTTTMSSSEVWLETESSSEATNPTTPTSTRRWSTASATTSTTVRMTPKIPKFADDNPHKLVNALIFLLFISVVLLIIAIGVTVYFKFMKLEEAQGKPVRQDSGEFEPLNE